MVRLRALFGVFMEIEKYVVGEGAVVGGQGVRRRVGELWRLLDSVTGALQGGGVCEFHAWHGRITQWS